MTDKDIIKALIIHDKGITTCVGCPYTAYSDCSDKLLTDSLALIKRQQAEIEICAETIKRQDKEIERLKKENKILSKNADTAFQDGLNEAQDLYAEQIKNVVRAEAVKEFAERFDDVLAGMRDEYAHFGKPAYGLVCEVVHHKLLKTVKEMVGTDNDK